MAVDGPPSPREIESEQRWAHKRCNPAAAGFYSGLGQICLRQDGEAAALAATTTVDLAGGITLAATKHDALLPLTVASDTWLFSLEAASFEEGRAHHERFVPQDSISELAFAPFNPNVLKDPFVWGSLAGSIALDVAVSFLLLQRGDRYHFGAQPRIFGADLTPAAAYPIAGVYYGGIFEQVALGEESIFRGFVQSAIARHAGETWGVVGSAYIFGAFHVANIIAIDKAKDRERYLAFAVPAITIDGHVLGLLYRHSHYSLAPGVAWHFWYDVAASMVDFASNPRKSEISAKVNFPF
jgi:membrane protease YdiL (CAAX protease family)